MTNEDGIAFFINLSLAEYDAKRYRENCERNAHCADQLRPNCIGSSAVVIDCCWARVKCPVCGKVSAVSVSRYGQTLRSHHLSDKYLQRELVPLSDPARSVLWRMRCFTREQAVARISDIEDKRRQLAIGPKAFQEIMEWAGA